MKTNIKLAKYIVFIFAFVVFGSCTETFQNINTDPTAITGEEASAKYFFTGTQIRLFAPDRFYYWRAQLINSDRMAGYFSFGLQDSYWSGELCYVYNSAYNDATWDYFGGYSGNIFTFLRLTASDGPFANEKMHAVGLIMKSLYFQLYTDTFGMIPYSEAGNAEIKLPSFDTQKEIYQGIIAELDKAMATIGNATATGTGVEDLGANDLFFDGDLQMWKKFANTLKLRLAVRALGAPDANFASQAIQEALSAPLLGPGENVLMPQDNEIGEFTNSAYGDVWWSFPSGGSWKVSNILIETLKDSDDPRLAKYAQPAAGGTISYQKPSETSSALWQKRTNFILGLLDDAGVTYTANVTSSSATFTLDEGTYYVGSPIRLRSEMTFYLREKMFSDPAQIVIQKKDEGQPIKSEVVMTAAESFFLQATAAVKGFGGNAQALYEKGIRQAMLLWNVEPAAIDAYLANSPMATLTGGTDDKLRKIAIQRWLANYTAGFEGWAVVRKTGYPKEIANGVLNEDGDIYSFAGVNGKFPKRLRYGNEVETSNKQNLQEALQVQGPDLMTTELWWQKK